MKKNRFLIALATLTLTVGVSGCGDSSSTSDDIELTTAAETTSVDSQSVEEQFEVTELPQLEGVKTGDTIATIKTNYGDIKVWFFPEYAPKAVENFTTHASEGYYDNLIFHRVINNFMIQGGDPLGNGTGGESIWGEDFEIEATPNLRHFKGALCMANTGAPNSNSSQFYIVQNDDVTEQLASLQSQGDAETISLYYPEEVINAYNEMGGYPYLDFGYTVFGQVYEGLDVVDAIAAVETDDSDKPINDVVIESIEVGTY